jgi:flagellar hook-basal body complex protein FliE
MTVQAVAAVAAEAALPTDGLSAASTAPIGFQDWLQDQIRVVNSEIITADEGVRRLAIGEPVSLHQVMVNLDRAKLHFDLALQVRNKLLEAYQDVMRMQI